MPAHSAPGWIAARVAEAVGRGERVDGDAALLLARLYEAGTDDVAGALALALGQGITDGRDDVAGWIIALSGASAVTADSLVADALRERVSTIATIAPETARELDAWLRAGATLADAAILRGAIDALERFVGRRYEPGRGIEDGRRAPHLRNQIDAASALLTAYDITRRLPYAMLADELMRTLLRTRRPGVARLAGGFFVECAAASVSCRLATLYHDDAYVRAAVVGDAIDYAAEAAALLAPLDDEYRTFGWRAAPFALAVLECDALTANG